MEIIEKVLVDALVIKPSIFEDSRGYFYEAFNNKKFNDLINDDSTVKQ